MNIVFATTGLPHGQTTGGEIASQAFIDAMRAAGHQVRVFGFGRDDHTVPNGSTCVAVRAVETASAGWSKYFWLGRSLLTGRPYVCEKFRARHYLNELRRATGLGKADVLVIDHAQMGWLLPEARRLARSIVFIAHNHEASLYAAEAMREQRLIQRILLRRDSRLLSRLEPHLVRAVDQIWTLSPAEQAIFGTIAGEQKTSLMPLAGRQMPSRPDKLAPGFDIGLLGTWAWDVNGRGLDWFAREVAPLLPSHCSIRVAGRGSKRVNDIRPNLTGVGFVDDPVRFMHEAQALAVPAISGAGVQIKTIEAIASGVPTVSTSLGVRGLGDLPAHVAIADTPETFAAALLRQIQKTPAHAAARAWAESRQGDFERSVAAQLRRLAGAKTSAPKALADAEP